jgi:Mn-containing catalase
VDTGEQWERVDDLEEVMPADEGDGTATVKLRTEAATAKKVAERGPTRRPMTPGPSGRRPGAADTDEDRGSALTSRTRKGEEE